MSSHIAPDYWQLSRPQSPVAKINIITTHTAIINTTSNIFKTIGRPIEAEIL